MDRTYFENGREYHTANCPDMDTGKTKEKRKTKRDMGKNGGEGEECDGVQIVERNGGRGSRQGGLEEACSWPFSPRGDKGISQVMF